MSDYAHNIRTYKPKYRIYRISTHSKEYLECMTISGHFVSQINDFQDNNII